MAKDKELKIVYSTLFQLIGSVKLRGWCVHMVCLQGEGFFTYDGRPFHVKKHDAVVINAPQQVHVVSQSEDLKVEVLAAPHDFLSNQLPANNYGIGGSISLYDNPVIPLSEGCGDVGARHTPYPRPHRRYRPSVLPRADRRAGPSADL